MFPVFRRRLFESHDRRGCGRSGGLPELLPGRAGHHQEAAVVKLSSGHVITGGQRSTGPGFVALIWMSSCDICDADTGQFLDLCIVGL